MAKVLTRDEQQLFNELTKLARRANQRIIRLEKETKLKAPFEVKQLYDYIDTFAITKSGRAKISKTLSEKEMKIEMKALKDFLDKSLSTAKGVKKYKRMLELETGEDISYKQANIMFEARKHWTWIYDYFPGSEFFAIFVWPARRNNWSKDLWISRLAESIKYQGGKIPDEDLRNDLIDLYNYFVEEYEK